MKEFDVVMLTADYEEIPAGTLGTIVQKYTDHLFEVEYFDNKNDTISVETTPIIVLDLVQEF